MDFSEIREISLEDGSTEYIDRSVISDPKERENLETLAEAKASARAAREILSSGKDMSDSDIGKILSESTLKLAIHLDKVGDSWMPVEEPRKESMEHAEWNRGKDLRDRAERLTTMASSFDSGEFENRREAAYAVQYLLNFRDSMKSEGKDTTRLEKYIETVQDKTRKLPLDQ